MVKTNMNEDDMTETTYAMNAESRALLKELEEDAPEKAKLTEVEIEEKYSASQAKIYIQRNDFLIPNILQMVKEKEVFDLTPSYQRRLRWSDKKKSHLIESLLMNVPIPPIFLYEKEFAKYEVMDGQQRLKTITGFYNNEFKLRDLKKWSELNGRYFSSLPPKIQAGLSRRGLAAVIVLTESSQDEPSAMELRQYVFERLNTGGQILNAQEVRNCIYSGNLNDTLVRIARSELFTSTWGIPPKESGEPQHISVNLTRNSLYSTMSDCLIVLRFFALLDLSTFKGSMKNFLDIYMADRLSMTKKHCKNLEHDYVLSLKAARDIYGECLFRLPGRTGKLNGRRSIPLADVVLISIHSHLKQAEKLIRNREYITNKTKEMLLDKDNYLAIVGHGITKAAIEKRIKLFDNLMKQTLTLGE